MPTFISICIPAYKRIDSLRRLLDSIAIQTYKQFEVVVTDDSPDNSVENLCKKYRNIFELKYFKNDKQLGTPENWNEGVRQARGEWIKIMHDDDWFLTDTALANFVKAAEDQPDKHFIFSAYTNIFPDQTRNNILLNKRKLMFLQPNVNLLSENVIGPPSVTLYKKSSELTFDSQLKWLVDMDFYIQYLGRHQYHYIDQSLIAIGINDEQVTKSSFQVASVEIPEHFHVLSKLGNQILRNPVVFDTFWRLFRNLGIQSEEAIWQAGYHGSIPRPVSLILVFQKRLPKSIISNGIFSKSFMTLCWIFSLFLKKGFIEKS